MWIHLQSQASNSSYYWFNDKSSIDKIHAHRWATNPAHIEFYHESVRVMSWLYGLTTEFNKFHALGTESVWNFGVNLCCEVLRKGIGVPGSLGKPPPSWATVE